MTHEFLTAALAREGAATRQHGVCLACGDRLGATYEAHHRKRRALLGWCLCNIVALHPRCHTQGRDAVHDQPEWARARGLIVPSWEDPRLTPVVVPLRGGVLAPVLLACDGGSTLG